MKPEMAAFLRLLFWRPHRALAVGYWHLTGRKKRALIRLRGAVAGAPFLYAGLIRDSEEKAARDPVLRDLVSSWADRPMFSILAIIPSDCKHNWITNAIQSVTRQRYDKWELLLIGKGTDRIADVDDCRIRIITAHAEGEIDPLLVGLTQARGEFVIPLAEGAVLSNFSLLRFGEAVRREPQALIVYGDEDRIDRAGRRSVPWFKPNWNPEMILALDFISNACAFEIGCARDAARDPVYHSSPSAFALLLAITKDQSVSVVHIQHVIMHQSLLTAEGDQSARLSAVAARVEPAGAKADNGPFGTIWVRWPMPDPPPQVTILVPTRDRVDLVQVCVESLIAKTRYPNFTVVIIDNGSVDPATIDYFAQASRIPQVIVLPCDMPYNFSAINNVAANQAPGEYLCFLNNDTEIVDGEWLGEMMRYAVRPGIGAVGPQLLYADGSIQHAGVVIGLVDGAGHAHRGLPKGKRGYFAQAYAPHFASAVTAACMVVKKNKFLEVGGFDAEHLGIAYNDVDLCLKLHRAGWRTVYAPQAKLLHLETKSRGFDLSATHVERYIRERDVLQRRWRTQNFCDPMHHPALDRGSETYRITF